MSRYYIRIVNPCTDCIESEKVLIRDIVQSEPPPGVPCVPPIVCNSTILPAPEPEPEPEPEENTVIKKEYFWDIESFENIYEDDRIKIIWNPLYKLLQWCSKELIILRGGTNINNGVFSGLITFQAEVDDITKEYFFASEDAELDNIDINFAADLNWNRIDAWITSVYENFPYYELKIRINSNRCIMTIEKYESEAYNN